MREERNQTDGKPYVTQRVFAVERLHVGTFEGLKVWHYQLSDIGADKVAKDHATFCPRLRNLF